MANVRYDQSSFTQGQLDPRVQSRIDWINYYKGAKEITNGLVIPQGGVQRRWGTAYVDTCVTAGTNVAGVELSTMVYNNDLIYLMLWEATSIKIYLENILIATVATQYATEDIQTLRFSQVQTRVIVTTSNYAPQQLQRSPDAGVALTANTATTLTAAVAYTTGQILPVQFTASTTLPTTTPQVFANRDYFILMTAANTFSIYSSSSDAVTNTNTYAITNFGVGATVVVQNTWAIANIVFKFLPAYDFNGGYFGAGFTFTPSAVSGSVTITSSGAIFTAAMVGGIFQGNSGILRIVTFTDSTHIIGYTTEAFSNTNAIVGSLCFLGEPAWSATRQWPSTSSFLQNRLIMANTPQLPNGQWLSVINDVFNFDDSETAADDAISYYPASGTMSVIQSMTSTRSLIVHTNTGNYSTPVQSEIALTPTNYVLIEQNKFGVGNLQPVFIDNQIFFVDHSGNNIINMVYEFAQSSYVTNNISVKSSNLISNPTDMAAFAEPNFVDGFYVLFTNDNGSLCILQTLHEEEILAFSLSTTNTYITNDNLTDYNVIPSQYVHVNSTQNRCWFIVNRQIPIAQSPIAISAFLEANNSLTAMGHGLPVGIPALVTFTTSGNLPVSNPQLAINTYYWALALDVNTFQVYLSQANAANGMNVVVLTGLGLTSNVVPWVLTATLMIEEADFDFYTDCSFLFTFSVATTVLTGLSALNGQVVQVVADGFVLSDEIVINGQITIERASLSVRVGLRYITTLVPLPVAIPQVPGTLYQQKHIRNVYVNYYNTIGSQVQGFGMPVIKMQNVVLGAVPLPETGVFEYTLMEGWDGATPVDIEIVQEAPLPMTIIGLSYILELG